MDNSFMDDIDKAIGEAMHGVNRALEEAGLTGGDDSDSGREPMERSFEVGPGSFLSVSNVSGEIIVRGADTGTIQVHASKRGSGSRAAQTEITFSQEGNRVTVGTKGTAGGLFAFGRNAGRVDYRITVPRDCSLDVHTVSGEADIAEINAAVAVESVSGDVVLRHVHGDLSTTTVSGDVHASDLVGAFIMRTTSGDAAVEESRVRRFQVNTVSGDFHVETTLTVGEHYFAKTVSGDMILRIPPSTAATIQLRTTSGDVLSEMPAEIIRSGRRHWQGRINGGGANVEMHSVSGDLRIERGNGRPDVSPAPEPETVARTSETPAASAAPEEMPPGDEEDTTSILRRLEQGEISVEEAMARLDMLNR